MTIDKIAALFGAMVALAILPSPSVFAVVARSIASGFTHGLITAFGILCGDFFYIVIAIYGLSTISNRLDSLLVLINYLGAVYLIWTGTKLCVAKSTSNDVEGIKESSWLSSFLSGLFITLGDSKAIFFYLSFFSAFLDLNNISKMDTFIIMAIATIAVGGVKVSYAYLADRAKVLFLSEKAKKGINLTAGIVMITTGVFLVSKT